MLHSTFKPLRIAGLAASLALFGALGLTVLTADPPVRRHDGFGIGSTLAQGAVVQAGAAIQSSGTLASVAPCCGTTGSAVLIDLREAVIRPRGRGT